MFLQINIRCSGDVYKVCTSPIKDVGNIKFYASSY